MINLFLVFRKGNGEKCDTGNSGVPYFNVFSFHKVIFCGLVHTVLHLCYWCFHSHVTRSDTLYFSYFCKLYISAHVFV